MKQIIQSQIGEERGKKKHTTISALCSACHQANTLLKVLITNSLVFSRTQMSISLFFSPLHPHTHIIFGSIRHFFFLSSLSICLLNQCVCVYFFSSRLSIIVSHLYLPTLTNFITKPKTDKSVPNYVSFI